MEICLSVCMGIQCFSVFSGDRVVDQVSLLTALTIFLLSAGPDVCTVEPLHALCLQRFTNSMDAKDPLVSTTSASFRTQVQWNHLAPFSSSMEIFFRHFIKFITLVLH